MMKVSTTTIPGIKFSGCIVSMLLCLGNGAICPEINDPGSSCSQGCWLISSESSSNDKCQPVGVGYFSPNNDNDRYPCEPGSFSNTETAASCRSCPAGSYAYKEGMTGCDLCPPSTYSAEPQSTYCLECEALFYDGDGSVNIQVFNGISYCLSAAMLDGSSTTYTRPVTQYPVQESSTTEQPTDPPSLQTITLSPTTTAVTTDPTQEPSTMIPTTTYPSTVDETLSPTHDATTQVSNTNGNASSAFVDTAAFPFVDGLSCDLDDNEYYIWHGRCRECPSQLVAMLYPLWIFLFLVSVIVVSGYYLKCCICVDIFWLGLEYVQYLYLLGLTPLTSLTPILQKLYGVLSIFALDLDAGLSLQCVMENFSIGPTGEQIFGLCIPIFVFMVLSAMSKLLSKDGYPVTRWMTIGLYLGYTKLFMTSLEAMRCSLPSPGSSSWFCGDELLGSILGSVGMFSYGIAFPVWLLLHLRRSVINDDQNSSQAWVQEVFPFQNTCWWWIGFWMARKAVLAVFIVVFVDRSPTIILTALLVTLMLSEVLQRIHLSCATPETESKEVDGAQKKDSYRQGSHRLWFQAAYVDLTLQVCLCLLTAMTFIFFALSAEDTKTLGILFLVLFFSSGIYWIMALCHCRRNCVCHENDGAENENNGTIGQECQDKAAENQSTADTKTIAVSMGNDDVTEPSKFVSDTCREAEKSCTDNLKDCPNDKIKFEQVKHKESDEVAKRPNVLAKWLRKCSPTKQPAVQSSGKKTALDNAADDDISEEILFDGDESTLSSKNDQQEDCQDWVGGDNASVDSATLEEVRWEDEDGKTIDPRVGDWIDAETGETVVYEDENNSGEFVGKCVPSYRGNNGAAEDVFRKKTLADENSIDDCEDNVQNHHGRQILETKTTDSGDTLVFERSGTHAEPSSWGKQKFSPVYQPPN